MQVNKSTVILLLFIAVLPAFGSAACASSNNHAHQHLAALWQKSFPADYLPSRWGFRIQLEDAILGYDSANPGKVDVKTIEDRIGFDFSDYRVMLLPRENVTEAVSEYTLRVKHKKGQSFRVKKVVCGIFEFAQLFKQVIRHTDGSILASPINWFLRTDNGGAVLGLAYPYQQLSTDKDGKTFQLVYTVEVDVAAGQDFVTEPLFMGRYKFSGLGRYKPLEKVAYRFITPHPEERDLAEIHLMKNYLRARLPYHPVRGDDQFHMFLNSWWAGLALNELKSGIDLMAEIGVPYVGTRETYYGLTNHVTPCPKLENVPDDFRVPIVQTAKEMMAYARSKGIELISFVTPCRSFKPQWQLRDKKGEVVKYASLFNVCFAHRPAAEFAMNLWDKMLDDAGDPGMFAFDGRLLTSFNEVDLFPEPVGPLSCHAENHAHLPGENFYADYKNVCFMMHELRRRHPNIFLEVYWGVKRAMPWIMAYFNGCENWYESNSAQDDRMQAWYNQNYRFLPCYKNFAQVRGYTDEGLRKSILSCISVSGHLQIGVGVKLLDRPENQAFFKKWTRWANENHSYLRTKCDLFGQPCALPLDGSAHVIDDKGCLFLFNESGRDRVGAVPLNHNIGINKGDSFDIDVLYPKEKSLYTDVSKDATVYLPVKAGEVAVFALRPAKARGQSPQSIRWINVGGASMEDQILTVRNLQAWQGQQRSVIALVSEKIKKVIINDQSIPFMQKDDLVLADLQFGLKPSLKSLSLSEVFNVNEQQIQQNGAMQVDNRHEALSAKNYGSGIYEMDVQCDFGLGGLQFKVDEQQKGGDAVLLLNYFAPIDGNVGLWCHAPQGYRQFPVHWTLDGHLKKGKSYRIRVQTFGPRHSITVFDSQSGDKILGPFDYCFHSIPATGKWGFRVREGSAIIQRAAFAESTLTDTFEPLSPPEHLVMPAFRPRSETRIMGQWAPEGTPMPIGADKAKVDFDYAAEQKKLWGGQ